MDKLIQSTAKYCIEIVQKDNNINIQQLHRDESEAGRTRGLVQTMNDLSPLDQAYRKKVENALEDEFLFRVTVTRFKGKSQIGIQLMSVDEDDDDEDQEPGRSGDRSENRSEKEMANIEDEPIKKPPIRLFLKRNATHTKAIDADREKRFTTQAGSISMSKSIPVRFSSILYTKLNASFFRKKFVGLVYF